MSNSVKSDERDEIEPDTDDGAAVSILTNGDPFRSFLTLPVAIVDECKLHAGPDGLHITACDPANVAMIDVTFPAEGFRGYDAPDDEVTVGVSLDTLRSAVSWARKRGDDGDPVSIDVFKDPDRMRVSVTRTDQRMKRVSEWFALDSDSIRQEPEVQDLDLPDRADPDPSNLLDAVGAVDDHRDYAYITRDGSTFVVSTQEGGDTTPDADDDDPQEGAVFMPETAWSENGGECRSSMFSLDYLKDIAAAVKKSKADRLTVKWGDELPTKIHFESEDWGVTGDFMLAPRLEQ